MRRKRRSLSPGNRGEGAPETNGDVQGRPQVRTKAIARGDGRVLVYDPKAKKIVVADLAWEKWRDGA
jgi:hypothetical protein